MQSSTECRVLVGLDSGETPRGGHRYSVPSVALGSVELSVGPSQDVVGRRFARALRHADADRHLTTAKTHG